MANKRIADYTEKELESMRHAIGGLIALAGCQDGVTKGWIELGKEVQGLLSVEYVFEDLWNEKQLSVYLKVDESTLQNWRMNKIGPNYIKISGRCIRYRPEHVRAWVESKVECPYWRLKDE